ncbi:hypothetical protein V6N11_071740 [Hibiscus sabdariffa]|uniref:Uncharacterized protein n=1 Tax=Hibiscus sabdariffa TaxID=183260 RepID=A0ABR2U0Y1_9ROSI
MRQGREEIVVYVLRDCLTASSVWNRVVCPWKILEFMILLPGSTCFPRSIGCYGSSVMDGEFVEHGDLLMVCSRVAVKFSRSNAARVEARANADGACSIGTGKAALRGVIRDEYGK